VLCDYGLSSGGLYLHLLKEILLTGFEEHLHDYPLYLYLMRSSNVEFIVEEDK